MVEAARYTFNMAGIIMHPGEERVLLRAVQGGWMLPQVEWQADEYVSWKEVARFNREMQSLLDVGLSTVRCLGEDFERATMRFSRVYVMELHSSHDNLPADACWMDVEALKEIMITPPEHLVWLEEWLAKRDEEERTPWYHPGWLSRAEAWIEQALAKLEVQPIVSIEQIGVAERGSLLRVQTAKNTFYFKALPAFFQHELTLLQHLARYQVGCVPALVAVDERERWLLMHDFGDRHLDQSLDLADWQEALRRYAILQIDHSAQVEQLEELGCPRLPLATLPEQLGHLLTSEQSLLFDTPTALSLEQVRRLHDALPLTRSLCQELAGYALPETLEHGDLHAQNIVLSEGDYLYYDWTDSCIAHPFFSLYPFLLDIEARWPEARTRLREAYLQPWERYATREQLVDAFELAQRLAPLHLSMLYATLVIPQMKDRWEMQHGIPLNLKVLLDRLDAKVRNG
ncbi:hypothetical protein KSD_62190 [Ktedonobacter sp. SOSP1-85]|uniref:aminoglycoside phosphotransferase family protein n=1 Tax=Ktedonobacter sp. SOSP1-85 TaxID=2778367 RepID=UPI001914E236|nr:aminoglycoside phosphotransferase family protein [Ktedonobacter sp. SOSP1-85]GHO78448.1 hypothetical protein KSD_62190 [Ktedonobacter sp. SOSP1-85]